MNYSISVKLKIGKRGNGKRINQKISKVKEIWEEKAGAGNTK